MDATTENAEFEALFAAAVDAIVVADAHGHILRCNSAACRLFGYGEDELSGQNVRILMPEREAERHDAYMAHHMSTGEERIIGKGRELDGRRKDGTTFPLHLSIGRSETHGGPRFVAILHDLSRRRAAQLALERSQRLGAIGEMTGGIAHDFNNILTIIIGNLELAANADVTPDVRSLLHDALEAAELGADLTGRLLAFARQSRLAPVVLDTTMIVERAVSLFRRTLRRGHEIHVTLDPDTAPIHADTGQLQSALLNLLRNAEDALEGDGVILVTTENVEVDATYLAQEIDVRPGAYVRISVSDSGTGMDEEARRRAFEPFFTTKPHGKGTGLGLATAYGFVRQSGGHITLYSEPRQGTTVSIYLPQSEVAAPATVAPSHPPPLPGRGEIVLVVEDNAAVRRMTGVRLAALGYTVAEVGTADEAIDLIRGGAEVDFVFSDIMMPGEATGLDLARMLRAEHPKLPVLLATGYAGEMTDAEVVDGFALIRKPYRQEELAAAIDRTMALYRS